VTINFIVYIVNSSQQICCHCTCNTNFFCLDIECVTGTTTFFLFILQIRHNKFMVVTLATTTFFCLDSECVTGMIHFFVYIKNSSQQICCHRTCGDNFFCLYSECVARTTTIFCLYSKFVVGILLSSQLR
jgi:hypothetical protein